jgi:dTDP-4-dehydrorhamnose 3,5-epimerase
MTPPAPIPSETAAKKSPSSRSASPIKSDLSIAKPASGLIHGVIVVPLKRIPDERGTVMHMLRSDDPHFRGFGEIYFSTVYPGIVKGWHRHRDMTLNYACVWGRIKLVLFDDRSDSPTRGALMERFLGPDDYSLVQVPPGVWNGFKGMGEPHSIVANCCTHAHDPNSNRSERFDPFDNRIPYDWRPRCH